MSLVTAQDLVTFALKATGVLGVGQSALAEDNTDSFSALNGMVGQWNAKRWLIYQLVDYSIVSTGAVSYTVGVGGQINTPGRATRLESAFFRQFITSAPAAVDYPLTILQSREDYNRIVLKGLVSWPGFIFLDSGNPLGNVYPWPVAAASLYELHITLKQTLPQFATYVQAINLPEEYVEALWTNLALRLSAIYPGASVTDDTRKLAAASLETIRVANTEIPRLGMPTPLTRGSLYNIYSDSVY